MKNISNLHLGINQWPCSVSHETYVNEVHCLPSSNNCALNSTYLPRSIKSPGDCHNIFSRELFKRGLFIYEIFINIYI